MRWDYKKSDLCSSHCQCKLGVYDIYSLIYVRKQITIFIYFCVNSVGPQLFDFFMMNRSFKDLFYYFKRWNMKYLILDE